MTTAQTARVNSILTVLGGANHATREQWLQAARDELFTAHAWLNTPETEAAHVGAGFPPSRGTAVKSPIMGTAILGDKAKDGRAHVYINPRIAEPVELIGILAHQLAHVRERDISHDANVSQALHALGSAGRLTAAKRCNHEYGSTARATFAEMAERLGDYPALALDAVNDTRPKQTTRMIKVACANGHDYSARMSREKLDNYGPPICPACVAHGFSASTMQEA